MRTKVTAVLVSLAALWAFAAWVTLRDGLNLAWVAVYNKAVAEPSDTLLLELQQERRLSVVRLAAPGLVKRDTLAAQRARTDSAIANFRRLANGSDVRLAASDELRQRISESFLRLDQLGPGRDAIDAGHVDRARAVAIFTAAIDSLFKNYNSLATLDDEQIAKDTRSLIGVNWSRELLSQEDALLAGVFAAGQFTEPEHRHFTELVGIRRYVLETAVANLPEGNKPAYSDWSSSAQVVALTGMEDELAQSKQSGRRPFLTAIQWQGVSEPALAGLKKIVTEAGDDVVGRASAVAAGVIIRLVLAGVLGLVAVVASVILSVSTARALVRQLERLRAAALELANERLPGVVARLAQGEKVDVKAEAPPLAVGDDLIGQLGAAFNTVQETAIRTAVEEAQLRQSIRDILLSLARRTQSLVHRQLTLLDVMERRESDPAELKDLFRIDHLATRMRRNAENLIVLSGASPARSWRRSVPMVNVVRGALAEVEDYTRVSVLPMGQVGLGGRAVGDVIHLLAELIENAVSFSPPYTSVQVGGQVVASGYAIEIEDRGLGMTPEDLKASNERIANPPEFNLSSTARLGLYVVSRLAERHGIRVALKASPYGGTTAVVFIPRELVIQGDDGLSDQETDPALRRGARRGPGEETGPAPERGARRGPEQERSARRIALVGAPRVVPEPAQEVVPVQSVPEPPTPPPPASFTPSGLPFRVPQASLPPELAENSSPVHDDDDTEDRSPDDIRKIMGSFQSGTRRGRSEAARLVGEGEDDQ
ncbi:nitrate- and nitrite sensing domain-containing protein [Microbispora sp. NPDC049125]|uniref:sensor histidine kinase n=1 Tax=Microbispora sp. NPDC049125 TaxID=3154929 RepID=UPI0034665C63